MVLRIFKHRNVEFLIAPYLAWAQVCFNFPFPTLFFLFFFASSAPFLLLRFLLNLFLYFARITY